MTTVQIIGIAVASVAAILLIIALIVARQRGEEPRRDAQPGDAASFLDEAPQDTFSGLGEAEQPVEDVTLDPAVQQASAARLATAKQAQPAPRAQPAGLGLDWGPDLHAQTAGFPAEKRDLFGERDEAQDTLTTPTEEADHKSATAPQPATPEEDAAAPREPGGAGELVPLSDIIVTTSTKLVDLQDPEVRRMLTELVTFEIDQAEDSRRLGQTVDAVLQLTEAEKVSRALGMHESARRIRDMMEQIRRQG